MTEITSLQNEKIKKILKIRNSKRSEEDALFGVEGAREIDCALKGGYTPVEVYYSLECISPDANRVFSSLNLHPDLRFNSVSKPVFQKIAMREGSDGLFVLFRPKTASLADLPSRNNAFYLILEGLEKPGNLGAILRTADCIGVDAVIVASKRVDIFNPNVIRASLGAIFLMPVFSVGSDKISSFMKNRGVKIICADPGATKRHFDVSFDGSVALVLGSEADGISDYWLGLADERLQIPMKGTVNSLNVSVAAAVLMYEVLRQRSSSRCG